MSTKFIILMDKPFETREKEEEFSENCRAVLKPTGELFIIKNLVAVETLDDLTVVRVRKILEREFAGDIKINALTAIMDPDLAAIRALAKAPIVSQFIIQDIPGKETAPTAPATTTQLPALLTPPDRPKTAPSQPSMLGKFLGIKDFRDFISKSIGDYLDARDSNSYFSTTIPKFFLNTMLVGPTGVGKTELSRAVAHEFKNRGVIDANAPQVFINAKDVIEGYIGQSDAAMRKVLESARGGTLIIDEIDTLLSTPQYGEGVLRYLNSWMGNNRNSPILIATCYGRGFEDVMRVDAGLRGRFNLTYHLEPYSSPLLAKILVHQIQNCSIDIADEQRFFKAALGLIESVRHKKGGNFTNVREIDNIFPVILRERNKRMRQAGLLQRARKGEVIDEAEKNSVLNIQTRDVPLYDQMTGGFIPRPAKENQNLIQEATLAPVDVTRPKVIPFPTRLVLVPKT